MTPTRAQLWLVELLHERRPDWLIVVVPGLFDAHDTRRLLESEGLWPTTGLLLADPSHHHS